MRSFSSRVVKQSSSSTLLSSSPQDRAVPETDLGGSAALAPPSPYEVAADMHAARGRSRGKRAIAVLATTLVVIAVIEAAVFLLAKPHRADRTNFLHLDFAGGEIVQRAIVFLKMRNLATEPTDIVQVGDSSGMHGVVPAVMQSKLGGARYLNLNVATTLGYVGYYTIAKYALENQKQPGTIKYLVVYVSAPGIPRSILWDDRKLIGFDLQREYDSAFHRAFQIPSLGVRQTVSRRVYYGNGTLMQPDAPITDNEGFDYFNHIHRLSRGWVRETDLPGDLPTDLVRVVADARSPVDNVKVESFFDWRRLRRVTYMEHIYGLFNDLADKHGAKLIVVFNPLPEVVRPFYTRGSKEFLILEHDRITAELRRMRDVFPNAHFETEFTYWPNERFSVFSHVASPFAEENTERLASVLAPLMPDLSSNQSHESDFQTEARIDLTRVFSGYGWQTDKQPDESLVSWIGPRDVASVWTAVEPGRAYTVSGRVTQAKGRAHECLALVVNGQRAQPKRSPRNELAEWTVPAASIARWDGWVRMVFTTRCSSDVASLWDANYPLSAGRSLAISDISVVPE
jgi:hypothetical protein